MRRWNRLGARWARPSFARGVTHALVLVAVGLMVGVSSLTASASEVTATRDLVPATRDLVPMVVEMPQSPADLTLKVGETVFVDDGALKVTLLAVTEDSRCPKDVMCVWAGQAIVALHIELDGADRGGRTAKLMPGRQGQPDLAATVDRYTLALVDLQPYPDRSHPEPTLETVATLHIATTP
jgi:hypothetical protein